MASKKNWIQDSINKPGALRKTTKTPVGKDIPLTELQDLAKQPGKTGQRARLALTFRKMNKKG